MFIYYQTGPIMASHTKIWKRPTSSSSHTGKLARPKTKSFPFLERPPQPPFPKEEKGFVFRAAESANFPVWVAFWTYS